MKQLILILMLWSGSLGYVKIDTTYKSTIDTSLTLRYLFVRPDAGNNLPTLVCMHSWQTSRLYFDSTHFLSRMTGYGLALVIPDMRGHSTSQGTTDASGREIYDIIDAVNSAYSRYSAYIDTSLKPCIYGLSGGGGNTMETITRFPDKFRVAIALFPMTDYGFLSATGWYQNTVSFLQSSINSVLGNPVTYPDRYKSRMSQWAVKNNSKTKIYLYHDTIDSVVEVANSRIYVDRMDSLGYTNYVYHESNADSSIRYFHQYPQVGTGAQLSESDWINDVLTHDPYLNVNNTGSINVNGYYKNNAFQIFAGAGTANALEVDYRILPSVMLSLKNTVTSGAVTAYVKPAAYINNEMYKLSNGSNSYFSFAKDTAPNIAIPLTSSQEIDSLLLSKINGGITNDLICGIYPVCLKLGANPDSFNTGTFPLYRGPDSGGSISGTFVNTQYNDGYKRTGYLAFKSVSASTPPVIKINYPNASLSKFSVFVWYRSGIEMTVSSVLSKWTAAGNKKAFMIALNAGKLIVYLSDDGTNTRKSYTMNTKQIDGVEHQFGFTFNSGTLKLWFDGALVTDLTKTTDATCNTIYGSSLPVVIGALDSSGTGHYRYPYNGYLNNVEIYNEDVESRVQYMYSIGPSLDSTKAYVLNDSTLYFSNKKPNGNSKTSIGLDLSL